MAWVGFGWGEARGCGSDRGTRHRGSQEASGAYAKLLALKSTSQKRDLHAKPGGK